MTQIITFTNQMELNQTVLDNFWQGELYLQFEST